MISLGDGSFLAVNNFKCHGEALLQGGQRKKAIAVFKKPLVINPGNEGPKQALAKMLEG